MAFPTSPLTFPARVPLAVVHAADLNAYADEIEAVESGWLSPNGQTLAPWRLRSGAVGLEFGDANAAGGGSTLCHQTPAGEGQIVLHGEPGTNPNSIKTRGIPGLLLVAATSGSGFYAQTAQPATADNIAATTLLNTKPDGQVLLSGVPVCRLLHTFTQSIANNTLTPLIFNTEEADVYGMHVASGSSVTIGAGMAGWYLVTGVVSFAAHATGTRILALYHNGGLALQLQGRGGAAATDFTLVWLLPCAALDVLELRVRQTSGAALNTSVNQNRFAVMKVA